VMTVISDRTRWSLIVEFEDRYVVWYTVRTVCDEVGGGEDVGCSLSLSLSLIVFAIRLGFGSRRRDAM
jgi:hypothetical protein